MANNANASVVVYTLVKDSERHEKDIREHDTRIGRLEVTVSALGAKLAVYSTLGAGVGGAVVALLTHLLTK